MTRIRVPSVQTKSRTEAEATRTWQFANLATLDYTTNRFLSPQAAMKEVIEDDARFEGPPMCSTSKPIE